MDMMNSLQSFFKQTIPYIVVKYSKTAREYETLDTKRKADVYVSAMMGTDSFSTYSYTEDILREAGFTEDEISKYKIDKYNIPNDRRDIVIRIARKKTIDSYVEENNYYRMLNGLPNTNDMEEIWLTPRQYDYYKIPLVPVHEIPATSMAFLERDGVLDSLITQYPKSKYLRYVGLRKIDIVSARRADNFELLYFPKIDDGYPFYRDFVTYYEECREYFLTVIHNTYYANKYEYYDNYIALTILIMAINKLISGMMRRFIERDFYDVETTKLFLECYGIKYDERFTLTQMKLLAKNLNVLLRSKATDKVFLDLLDLLGYSNFDIMKYYLVKQHKFGDDGKPIFIYKKDEHGNLTDELDLERMYEFYFSRAKVGTYNIQDALKDESKKLTYKEVVETDNYWVDDEKLRDKLLKGNFNYIETKYMDIDVIYRMHKIVFETVYVSRAILDKSNETKKIFLNFPKISSSDVSLYDVIITLICLLCKYYGVEPDLLQSPSKKLHILGFNFKADFDTIRQDIKNRPDIYDQRLLNYINNTPFTTPTDINNMYVNIKHLEHFLVTAMNNTTTMEAYRAYRNLYDTLMWVELDHSIYANEDGSIPLQFTECLKDSSPDLYDLVMGEEYTLDDLSEKISYITTKLSAALVDTRYLGYIQVLDNYTVEALLKLLRFFKSFTVDLRGANVVLLFDSHYHNMAHMVSDISFGGDTGHVTIRIPDESLLVSLIGGKLFNRVTEFISEKLNEHPMFVVLADLLCECNIITTHDNRVNINGKLTEIIDTSNLSKLVEIEYLLGHLNMVEYRTLVSLYKMYYGVTAKHLPQSSVESLMEERYRIVTNIGQTLQIFTRNILHGLDFIHRCSSLISCISKYRVLCEMNTIGEIGIPDHSVNNLTRINLSNLWVMSNSLALQDKVEFIWDE